MKNILNFMKRDRSLYLHTSLISVHPRKVETSTTAYNHTRRVVPLPHALSSLYYCCVLSQGKDFPGTKAV